MRAPGDSFPELDIKDKEVRRLFYYLFVYSRGAVLRSRIVLMLMERPMNKNELSTGLNVNYRTVEHHISVLIKNKVLDGDFRKYNSLFYINDGMREYLYSSVEFLRKMGGLP
ncbi:MAG: winged helix-turn-helix domain-containing protein [Thermoplasmatales archaeon]